MVAQIQVVVPPSAVRSGETGWVATTVRIDVVLPGTAGAEAARAVQRAVLRPHGPLPTDREPERDWLLVAAVDQTGETIGAASLCPDDWPRTDLLVLTAPQWQLRGVSVIQASRGTGVGSALVDASIAAARTHGAATLWAEARIRALPLYQRTGWHVVGDEWNKPGVGPHRYIWTALSRHDGGR